jgi:hypothetical protein
MSESTEHEAPEKPPMWSRIAERLGTPTLVMCFVGFCLYQFAGWVAPKAEKLLDGHLEFMHRTADTGEKTAEATKITAGIQVEIKDAIQEIKSVGQEQVENARESIKMHREVLDELKKHKLPGSPQSRIDDKHLPLVIFSQ